jgi:hypothetical protein
VSPLGVFDKGMVPSASYLFAIICRTTLKAGKHARHTRQQVVLDILSRMSRFISSIWLEAGIRLVSPKVPSVGFPSQKVWIDLWEHNGPKLHFMPFPSFMNV